MAIDYEKVLSQTIEVISSLSRQPVAEDSKLIADLELDSIGIAELIAEMEDRFNVVIPMEQLHELRTVRDVALTLVPLLNAGDDLESA